jgi:2-polyprenyl-3-methyl-5-hydroxy-6-metoxy-1,4-benzoquinol methylase
VPTNYDDIADQYKEAKYQLWRTHIERYTILNLVGDIANQTVVDLACGEGFYSRMLKRLGAVDVLGLDLSQGMIDLAKAEESREPLGIDFQVGDAREFQASEPFDFVFAAYLLNYASNFDELTEMCHAIFQSLKPGGRFLTVNNNPCDPVANFSIGKTYEYSKRLEGDLVEGAPIIWTFILPEGPLSITNYYISKERLEQALQEVGMRDIRWHPPQVSPEGQAEFGVAHWQPFLQSPPVAFIECFKA